MKKIGIGILIFFGCISLGALMMYLSLSSNMKEITAIELHDFDLSSLEDGMYEGSYYYQDEIGATLEVVVVDHKITEITFIEHIAGLGEKAEIITEDIIENQTLLVDDIAGATTSSHVIKLAIENALEEEK